MAFVVMLRPAWQWLRQRRSGLSDGGCWTELQDAGYEITIANDGEEGIETILSVQPDMVILDVMMPLMNGWEVCKYLREQAQFKDLPILMLTGIGRVVNDMTSPLYGASDHLDKPFEMEDLIERVDTLLAKADL